MRHIILLLLFFLISSTSRSQVVASDDVVLCDGQQGNVEVTLTATSFATDLIDSGINSDDTHGGVVDMGFDFDFYGNTYNQVVLSSNNYLTFNTALAGTGSGWAIGAAVPNNFDAPMNAILCPWQDIYPGVNGNGIIAYATTGEAPNRVFIASFCGIPMFSCTDICYSSQIKLFESTNIIETHIAQKVLCTTWNDGAAIHALHNIDGTIAHVVTGLDGIERNYPNQWTCENDGWRFIPNGVNDYTIENIEFSPAVAGTDIIWQDQFGNQIGTGGEITVIPGGDVTYTAGASLCGSAGDWCGFEGGIEGDDVNITFEELLITGSSTDVICYGEANGTIEIFAPQSGDWTYNLYMNTQLINTQQSLGDSFIFQNLATGMYSVEIIENNSDCVSEELAFNITEPNQIIPETSIIAATCNIDDGLISIVINGGTPSYNTVLGYSNGQIISEQSGDNILFSNLASGDYYFSIIDENDCLVSGDEIFFTVGVDGVDVSSADAGENEEICDTESLLSANEPLDSETGSWSLISGQGTIESPNSFETQVFNLGVGLNVFAWTLENECGISTDEVIITTINGDPTINDPGSVFCLEQIPLSVSVQSEEGEWSVNPSTGVIIDNPTSLITFAEVQEYGSYVFSFEGCNGGIDSFTITMESVLPDISAPDEVYCLDEFELSAQVQGDPGYWGFEGPGNAVFGNANSETTLVNVDTYGEYEFIYYGCGVASNVIVNMGSITPELSAPYEVSCLDEFELSAQVEGDPGYWGFEGPGNAVFSNANSETTLVNVDTYGEYEFIYYGCNSDASISVDMIITYPSIEDPGIIYCAYETELLVNSVFSGTWDIINIPEGSSMNIEIIDSDLIYVTVSDYGDYEIMFTDNCGISDTMTLTFSTAEPIVFAEDHQYCMYTVNLSAITPNNSSFGYWTPVLWPEGVTIDEISILDPQANSTQAIVPDFGVYIFEYIGCDEEVGVEVGVSCPMSVPNSFSPNGDGVNDVFIIADLDPNVYSRSVLYIYNKWGAVVHIDPNYGINGQWWDGTITYANKSSISLTPAQLFNNYNSGYVVDGVYYYTLEVYNEAVKQKEFYSGDINIFSTQK